MFGYRVPAPNQAMLISGGSSEAMRTQLSSGS